MPAAPIYTTTEADARFARIVGTAYAFRIKTVGADQFFQLKEAATSQWRTVFLANGVPQIGPAED